MRRYNPKEIEPKWQKIWADSGIYKTDMKRTADKFYVIPMLPYPSGDLHIGHWYNFAPADTVARFRRMLGQNVLTTIGFDAFGLPAENAAIKRGIQPAVWTHSNIESMTRQISQIGASYDWGHTLATCDPDYYRWNQWLFLKLYEKGLAYRAKAIVNWCPKDQTVLANEQVVGDDNVCERCGTPVIQKEMESWYFKITDYTERLLADLDSVDWPEKVKTMQVNWIGKSQGALIKFRADGYDGHVEVFTTRPDTIYGATFMVLAPEHKILNKLSISEQATTYIEESKRKTELERKEAKHKTGVFSGHYAINPATKEKIPIWIADYVLASYGTGAIMAVPAHDERDGEFAAKFDLPVQDVIEKPEGFEGTYTGEGVLINSGKYDAMDSAEAREKITGEFGKAQTNYKLRDWLISRQRYWGAPIPIVHCPEHGAVPVPESELPVRLPEIVDWQPTGTGRSPLDSATDWVETTCPQCGGPARRETDTMGGFACSSWYFLRFCSPNDTERPFDPAAVNYWMPVDLYVGGLEHAVMHLLYARFWTKVMYDARLVPFTEPFARYRPQGVVHSPLPDKAGNVGKRMSKSRGNVITPDSVVETHGADALRLYELFIGPFEQNLIWDEKGINGIDRFLNKAWELCTVAYESTGADADDRLRRLLHKTIKKVGDDLAEMRFNTAVSGLMILVNELADAVRSASISARLWHTAIDALILMLAPMAVFQAEELWHRRGGEGSVHQQPWPLYDPTLAVDQMVTIAVQINSKLRDRLEVPADATDEAVRGAAERVPKVAEALHDKQIVKVFYASGRLINFIVR
jgi:leucyl-tRNA synthetase